MKNHFNALNRNLISLVWLLVFLSLPNGLLHASMRFISVKNGLSNSSIHYIFQDKRSNVWIATDYGLNRIAGNDIKVFTQSLDNPKSLPNDYVLTVFEDSEGNFWVGTLSGLYLYDYKTETFSPCFEEKYPFISSTKISCIIEDRNKQVWIALNDEGLLCINLKDNSTRLYDRPELKKLNVVSMLLSAKGEIWLANKNDGVGVFYPNTGELKNVSTLYPDNDVLTKYQAFSLCEDNRGNMLVATLGGGLFKINSQTFRVQSIGDMCKAPELKLTQVLLRDSKDRIWVGTDGGGLWLFDERTEIFTSYFIDNFGFNPMVGKIENIYEDQQGNVWVSYMEKGVLVIPSQKSGFEYLTNNPYGNLEISDQSISSLLVDKQNVLWVGTNGSGLYRLILKGDRYVYKDKLLPDENVITCLYQDSENNIYIGTYLHGFYLYNPQNGTLKNFSKGNEHSSVNCNHITRFAEDQEGNIWISTNGGGVNKMERCKKLFTYFRQGMQNVDDFLLSDWCNTVFVDSDNLLWVGTYIGFCCMDLRTCKKKSYTDDKLTKNNVISTVCEDADGYIWIGTKWGLNKIDKKARKMTLYTTKEGLPSNVIASLQTDLEGNLWVGTNNGIARYVKSEGTFTDYGMIYGLNSTEFKPQSSSASSSGYLYFAGTDGVTWFNPQEMNRETPFSGLVFSKFMLFNKELSVGATYDGNVILPQSLQYIEEIVLRHNQNNFSIGFEALEFITPERIKYKYKLEGLDKEWQSSEDGSRTAVYTNLPHGRYLFTVKAYTNSSNTQTRQLAITILPPWWLTWWAKILYVILFLFLFYGMYRVLLAREKEKQIMLAKEHREQLSQSKLQLFTDISHEIRTPLTLIIAPLLKLIEENKESVHHSIYHIMYRNASRILRMVNQMLDIRKIDRGQMQLSVREVDIVSFVTDIVDSFMPLSQNKNIQLEFVAEEVPDTVWIDSDFMDKILYNLLSNAFKYTESGGKIVIQIAVSKDNKLEFKIEDNGKGIAPEYVKRIFERFYQVSNQQNIDRTGTGIGLHLCKMLAELHHGTIDVDSVQGKGSAFTLAIPYLKADYSEEETNDVLIDYPTHISSEEIDLLLHLDEFEILESGNRDSQSKNSQTILIVEDNSDIRALLRNELQSHFNVLEAVEGKKGYEIAAAQLPDLIITDIMMEGMDGIEMTRKLNENNHTRHIPIIMLTAKTTINDSLEGLGAGADVYINKPFDLRYLLMNIANLLKKRALIKAQHAIEQATEINNMEVKSANDKLVEKLNSVILKHIGNSDLSIEFLSSEVGISRVHLHRKMKELFNLTPSIYLRNVRLEHAATLLKGKKISISEVAYAIGFSSHQYFSNCFKDYYGISPAEYVHKNNTNRNVL